MTITADHRDEREIFLDALDLPHAARPAFVERRCGDNAALRRRMIELLAAHDAAGDYLGGPSPALASADPLLGTAIGPYTLTERLGEGGFGLVYVGEQREPLRRTVAIKLLRPGFSTDQVIARFKGERQALALMDHSSIAKVFDGGTTETGRPYFVMELVRGEPITTFCDQRNLSIALRIELLIDVSSAVHHAHQKAIIHRDLKPSNVLVTLQDGRPVSKVIDFGVAKSMGAALTDRSIHTDIRQLVGTPAYMSPEQAGGGDIDTRTDVYALGVLLYELLCGSPPLDPQRLRSARVSEIERMIREEEPPRPSTRVGALGEKGATTAGARRTDIRRLQRIVRGELDWITMKAIDKDPARRYDSAAAFAEDLRRYLRREPVSAGPPSATYRASRFVRRHRIQVAAGGAVAVAIACGLVVAAIGVRRALIERDAAIEAQRVADHRRHDAERMAERARVRSDFIGWGLGVGEEAQPVGGRRDGITVREMLDVASESIGPAYPGAPRRQALARQQLGALYHTIFLNEAARRELETALALWRLDPADRDDEAMVAALRDLLYVHRDLTATEVTLDPLRRERALLDLAILERRAAPAQRAAVARLGAVVRALLEGTWPGVAALATLHREARMALEDGAFACDSEEFVLAVDALAIASVSAASRWVDPVLADHVVRLIEWADERCPELARQDKAIAMLQFVAADLATGNGQYDTALRLCRLAAESVPHHLPAGHWIPAELRSLEGHVLRNLAPTSAIAGSAGRSDAPSGHVATNGEARSLLVEGCSELIRRTQGSTAHVRYSLVRLIQFTAATGEKGLLAQLDTPLRPYAEAIDRLAVAIGQGVRKDAAGAATELAAALASAPRGDGDPRPAMLGALTALVAPYADSVSGEAARPCRELLAALADVASEQSPDVRAAQATALWWQGLLLLTLQELDSARACFEKSLEIRLADDGPDRVMTHNAQRMLGRVIGEQGGSETAAEILVGAHADMCRVATASEVAVIATARDAALALAAIGRERSAGVLLATQIQRTLEAEDAAPGMHGRVPPFYHLLMARPLALIAGLPAGQYEVAERAGRRAMDGLPSSGLAPLTVGIALYRLGRFAEAEAMMAGADEIDASRERSPNPLSALFRGACCREAGRDAEAIEWFEVADKRVERLPLDRYTTRSWPSLRDELRGGW